MAKKIDLRFTDHKEAIIEIANAMKKCPLTDRALALLVADTCGVPMTQVLKVLDALSSLEKRYLKN